MPAETQKFGSSNFSFPPQPPARACWNASFLSSEHGEVLLLYLLRHTIERLVGGNFELYFVRVALARQTLKHTSDGVTVERTSTRHRQLQIKHL